MRFYFLITRAAAMHSARIISAHDEPHARQVAALAERTEPAMRTWLDHTMSECREISAARAGVVITLEGAALNGAGVLTGASAAHSAAAPAPYRPANAPSVDEWAHPAQKLQ